MSIRLVQRFLNLESSSAIILFVMAVISMIWANSPLSYLHREFIGHFLFLINDGLMAIFFLVVGLELKRGFIDGPLSKFSQVILPAIAALGGMVVPAIIYICINLHTPDTLRGWAAPVATDIAFAMGVLGLFGRRVPAGLKLFLLALAIFDDIGAILIIAVWYSHGFAWLWALISAVLLFILYLMKRWQIEEAIAYLSVGALLWISVYFTGLHPTIAGVLVAMMVPAYDDHKTSPLHRMENLLHPWVAYLIMPLFALANAGFSLVDFELGFLMDSIVLGIVFGLFVGKQIGVFGLTWAAVKLKLVKLPDNTTWLGIYGVSLLCGIGFTMSLFLGTLAFSDATYLAEVRMGVMLGSMLSGIVGAAVLRMALKHRKEESTGAG